MEKITRLDIIDLIESAFATGPATREALLATATAGHARPQMIALLDRLPDKTYSSPRDLWYDLPDVPLRR
jgi:hypothetical protein